MADDEVVIHEEVFEYRKIWSPNFGQKLNIKRGKINIFDPYAMGLYSEIKEKLKVLLSSDIFLAKYPDFINIS